MSQIYELKNYQLEYEIKKNKEGQDEIEIIKCLNPVDEVIVPSVIDGILVTSIARYAFHNCKELKVVRLPESVVSIGDYAFYNCYELAALNLPLALKSVGYGAYKNCSKLRKIEASIVEGEDNCINSLLGESYHKIRLLISYFDKDLKPWKTAYLVFTEYDYECVLQIEARQYDWVNYGSGNVVRQCVKTSTIDYAMYDSFFDNMVREDGEDTAIEVAVGRLLYPFELSDTAKDVYKAYLRDHVMAAVKKMLREDMLNGMELLTREELIADDLTDEVMEMVNKSKKVAFVGLLMDYNHRHGNVKKKKTFEL